jgi:hypothetical protein
MEFANHRWHDYTGLSSEESYGSGWKAAIHPQDLNELLQKWGTVPDLDKPRECEVRLRGYPSGHACASAASAAVLSYLFPADSTALGAMSNDAGTSTFDALIHTQLDVSTGFSVGGQVGQQVVARGRADGAN